MSGSSISGDPPGTQEGAPAVPADKPTPAPGKPGRTVPYPAQIQGEWQRDWRMGAELIGRGHISMAPGFVVVSGRRTNPLRSAPSIAWRLDPFAAAAGGISVLLTAIGFGWRTSSAKVFVVALVIGAPTLVLTWLLVRWLGRRLLEPPLSERLDWNQVSSIASNGAVVDIEIQTRSGPVQGRLVPRRRNPNLKVVLHAIRDATLPGGKGGDATRLLRPVWVDQALMLLMLSLTTGAAWVAEPWATSLLMGLGEPRDGHEPASSRCRRSRSMQGMSGHASPGIRMLPS